uniref:Isoform 2 of KH domain-containing, RNA-binding, signal transduction-associated protein 2 n=1 Tax=Mus musculus TaxID=10090 RepID=Q9WU01-2
MGEEKYLPELMAEKDSLDPSFVHASRLLAEEIEKFQGSDGKKEDEEKKYLDVISNKNIKLSERVLIPVKQYPKFNFVGKLLGPRGNSLKRLQEETGAKMSILGKGSMRDKTKVLSFEVASSHVKQGSSIWSPVYNMWGWRSLFSMRLAFWYHTVAQSEVTIFFHHPPASFSGHSSCVAFCSSLCRSLSYCYTF